MNHKTILLCWTLLLAVALTLVYVSAESSSTTEKTSSSSSSSSSEENKRHKKHERRGKKGWRMRKAEIIGNYTLVSDSRADDYNEYLKGMEFSDENREQIRNTSNVIISITKNEAIWTVKRITKEKNLTMTFESGKEFEGDLMDDRKANMTFTMNEDEKRYDRIIRMNGFNATHEVIFSRKGFRIMYKVKDVIAKQVYRRIHDRMWKGSKGFFERMRDISMKFRQKFRNRRRNDSSEDNGGRWRKFKLFRFKHFKKSKGEH